MLSTVNRQLIAINGLETAYEIAVSRFRAHAATGRPADHHKDDALELMRLIDTADKIVAVLADYNEHGGDWINNLSRIAEAVNLRSFIDLRHESTTMLCKTYQSDTPEARFAIAAKVAELHA